MKEKSWVSLEQHVCLVCGVAFVSGNLVIDKRLRTSMQQHTATGWGLCAEHHRLYDEGYIALVECDPQRSGLPSVGDRLKPEQAHRTGRLAHVKREAFARLFNVPLKDGQACMFVMFVDPDVIGWLRKFSETIMD